MGIKFRVLVCFQYFQLRKSAKNQFNLYGLAGKIGKFNSLVFACSLGMKIGICSAVFLWVSHKNKQMFS